MPTITADPVPTVTALPERSRSPLRHPPRRRTAFVTGAAEGIGYAVAARLTAMGWRVLLHARTAAEGAVAVDRLISQGADPERLRPIAADFTRLAEVRDLADQVTSPLDLLVNNAAVAGDTRRVQTADGHELTWQVDYLAPYLLTRLLLPALTAADGPRVVNLSSSLHRMGNLPWDDLDRAGRYSPVAAYAQAKLALTVFGAELAERVDGLTAVNVHPGVVRTSLTHLYSRSGAPVEDGALAVLRAAVSDTVNGGYYEGTLRAVPAPIVGDRSCARRLWRLSDRLVGLDLLSHA
ncbi:SDR family NAD(P)-dependent oxidoreductase [Micromonospora avicenniae]|uniref:NAD(P)-dependent dehydrogenase, short-chain alcohol dehydrogenase family n=1 Tax=Micromonospora avicenniae TaxID=1198245 RepID=A0A1N7DDT7_9ACTN|nr:SDR family NAD(P)-dependent oxidoreductase [Micromonospora avicenniae]SIR74003.1 NAD(P)-dependent dehydrogenase, short-chain alcohol dehydrogenase family [Micromonospora avicenniae]